MSLPWPDWTEQQWRDAPTADPPRPKVLQSIAPGWDRFMGMDLPVPVLKGGKGSGNFGHKGRAGLVGGSGQDSKPSTGAVETALGQARDQITSSNGVFVAQLSYTLKEVAVTALHPRERKPPQEELVAAYREDSSKIPPIAIQQRSGSKPTVLDGHKRLASAKAAGLDTVWAIEVHDTTSLFDHEARYPFDPKGHTKHVFKDYAAVLKYNKNHDDETGKFTGPGGGSQSIEEWLKSEIPPVPQWELDLDAELEKELPVGNRGRSTGDPLLPGETPVSYAGSEAVKSYVQTWDGYHAINDPLRQGHVPSEQASIHIKEIDQLIANAPVNTPQTVYRGVDASRLSGLQIGDTFTDKGFVSAAISPGRAMFNETGKGATLIIEVPVGSHMLSVSVFSDGEFLPPTRKASDEMIFARDTIFQVMKLDSRGFPEHVKVVK